MNRMFRFVRRSIIRWQLRHLDQQVAYIMEARRAALADLRTLRETRRAKALRLDEAPVELALARQE